MGFYQNVNKIEDNILKIEPITWGNFQILGLQENYPKDNPVFYNFYKFQQYSAPSAPRLHNIRRTLLCFPSILPKK